MIKPMWNIMEEDTTYKTICMILSEKFEYLRINGLTRW